MGDLSTIRLGGQDMPFAITSLTLNSDGKPMLERAEILDRGPFEVSGTITCHVSVPSGWFRRRSGPRYFLRMIRPHLSKRRFRRIRGKVMAARRGVAK